MKKFLTFFVVAAVAGAITNASAVDREGQFALGFQESITSNINGANTQNTMGAWSLKYGVSSAATVQLVVGFDMGNKSYNQRANFGARFLYDLVENENSDFYTGLGIVYDKNSPDDVLRFNIPLGFEWSFSGLPELGLSAEAGIMIDYRTKNNAATAQQKQMVFSSVGGNVGGALGLGVHYYF